MSDRDAKRAAHRALVDSVLRGDGTATPALRARAFSGAGLPPVVELLTDKVVNRPGEITDADFAAAETAGFSEDQLFELVICAAVGRSARLYDAGLAALAAATDDRGAR
ncbi:hypothetical protein ACWCPQ_03295 [Nocardia sp. NPDC001965]